MSNPRRLNRRTVLAGALSLAADPAASLAADDFEIGPGKVGRYDSDYPLIAYNGSATSNRIWRLQDRLARGDETLEWRARNGYLASLLRALEIDTDSQVLVFSKTSLHGELISDRNPRALYFNDDTYIGLVPSSGIIEIVALDARVGPVFFVLENRLRTDPTFRRHGTACLICHDNYSLMGGGVPRIMALSSPVNGPPGTPDLGMGLDVDDRTPVDTRWGGWYVTGALGTQSHLGNLPLRERNSGGLPRSLPSGTLTSLAEILDTSLYLTPKSDVVALLVLEHQKTVQNLITRVIYKVSGLASRAANRAGSDSVSMANISEQDQRSLRSIVDPLVDALFMVGAAPLREGISPSSSFAARFSSIGPHDSSGRSLRDLQLRTRLFRYPLSFMVHSDYFDALPQLAAEVVRSRVSAVLRGTDARLSSHLSQMDRRNLIAILADTTSWFSASRK